MKKNNIIYLNGLIDLAQSRLGSKIVYKSDEFFAPAKRIINPWPPVFKEGVFDDTSVGYLSATDNEGDEAHLPNMKSSTMVKCFAKFLEIDNVLREAEHGNKASAETIDYLRKIRNKIDKLLKPEEITK